MNKITSIKLAAALCLLALQPVTASAQSQPFVGGIMCAAFNFAPVGWIPLDGRLLNIAENDVLFSLLGTTFGGDGATTFRVPDMRSRIMISQGQAGGLSPRAIGSNGGAENITLATANLPSHTHSFAPLGSSNDATSISPAGKVAASKARTTQYAEPSNIVAMQAGTTSATGGNVATDKMPPTQTINCFIAEFGIFPPRN
jgi:microcystin-dependent protein